MMKNNLIALLASATVFMATLWARQTWSLDASAHGRYYMTAVLTISAAVTLITALRLIGLYRTQSINAVTTGGHPPVRPRQHYRLQFDRSPRPRFVQKADVHQPAAAFSCAVCDVSETGISLDCTGVFAEGQAVCGDLIFCSGRTAPVNGTVVRNEAHRTCLRLHCTIDPPLLMAEQREQIVSDKGNDPRPVVSDSLLNTTARSLPSHSPKGICRIKRP